MGPGAKTLGPISVKKPHNCTALTDIKAMEENKKQPEDKHFTPTTKVPFGELVAGDQTLIRQLETISRLSPAVKRKVGAIIGDPETGTMFTIGFNKMFDTMATTQCEDENGVTVPYVIHAEELAAISYMKQNFKRDTSKLTMYVSYAPCLFCSKMTSHMGIHRLVFTEKHDYKFDIGVNSPRAFLDRMGFEVLHVTDLPSNNQ
jgi:dCMP deaminase